MVQDAKDMDKALKQKPNDSTATNSFEVDDEAFDTMIKQYQTQGEM